MKFKVLIGDLMYMTGDSLKYIYSLPHEKYSVRQNLIVGMNSNSIFF